MSWRATILTLFPGMFPGPLGHSLAGRALESGIWALETRDIRDFAAGRHRPMWSMPRSKAPPTAGRCCM
jgi:tRNA (guanine37-N1)-methyltransferase